jgi:UDP-2,3-diacylglucosamine hydrolase
MAAAGGPLPAYFEIQAAAHWRLIDFISDMHLCEGMPQTFLAWQNYLLTSRADAIFILGDLFEVWLGDDAMTRPFEARCIDALAEAASRKQLALMVGNRDFLIGSAMLRAGGCLGLPDPSVLVAWGQRVLLSHGDALCLADVPYQRFRAEVRSAAWQQRFLQRPLAERSAIAAEIRAVSHARHRADVGRIDTAADADVDAAEAVRWMHALGTAELVHGHTHRPGSNTIAPAFKRHVLSDWDLDVDPAAGKAPRAEVLRLSRDGFQRLSPAAAG